MSPLRLLPTFRGQKNFHLTRLNYNSQPRVSMKKKFCNLSKHASYLEKHIFKFLVFTHMTFVLTTVAICHVGAQTNSYKCAYSKVKVRK